MSIAGRFVSAMAVLASMLVCAACQNANSITTAPAGLSCVDDSEHCVGQRTKLLDQYMSDKSKAWVKQPATPEAYASGVRLFALLKRRRELSCDELASGKREAEAGPGILRAQPAGKLTTAQVARGVMLAGEVSRDLGREYDKRCKKA